MKPDLHGSRVILRSINPEDCNDLFDICGDVKTMEFASDPVFTSKDMVVQLLESVIQFEELGESLEWAIVERTTQKVIGTCGLHNFSDNGLSSEVGCLLNSSYWRRGYMSESVNILFSHAKSLGIEKLYADMDEDNFRSKALFKKLGFDAKKAQYQRSL